MRHQTQWQWHLDEVFVKINGAQNYLRRTVDHDIEVLEFPVTNTRCKHNRDPLEVVQIYLVAEDFDRLAIEHFADDLQPNYARLSAIILRRAIGIHNDR